MATETVAHEAVVIRSQGDRLPTWALFLGPMLLMCGGVAWLTSQGPLSNQYLGLAAGFGGLMMMLGLNQFVGFRLTLGPSGLTYREDWKQRTWCWRDLGQFEVGLDGEDRAILFAVRGLASATTGAREVLPDIWPMRLEELCSRLNEARDRWGRC